MTLDEVIKRIEEIADEWEADAKTWLECNPIGEPRKRADEAYAKCKKSAEEHSQLAEWLRELKQLKEQEPCEDIKEYYKDIWECDINHPLYEDTVAEIVEKSYISGYVHGVENTAKEFRFELKQNPCEDAISRQVVLDLIVANHMELNGVNVVMYSPLYKDIKQLPSVTPQHTETEQPKTGYWKTYIMNQGGIDEEWLECSECMWSNALLIPRNYCPKCGTRMIESEVQDDSN